MATWNNTVPLGQAGTGSAVVFGRPNAADRFTSNVYRNQALQQQAQLRRQQEAQRMAQSYRDNMLAASEGRLWAPEIGKIEQDHIRRGMEYRAQGWDVYNPDPNDPRQMAAHNEYMTERRRIEGLRNYRSELEKQYTGLQKTLQSADIGEYDPADIQQLNDFVANSSIQELYTQGAQLPVVNKKFNPEEYLPGSAATQGFDEKANGVRRWGTRIDEQRTQRSVIASIMNAPGGARFIAQLTGGVDPMEVLNLPDSREGIKGIVERDLSGDPMLKEALAERGVLPGSPMYDEWMNEQTEALLEAKNRFQPQFNSWMAQVTGRTRVEENEAPDYTEENQQLKRRQAALAERREARLASEANSTGSKDINFVGAETIPIGNSGNADNPGNAGKTPVRNAVNFYNTTVSVTGGDAYNMNSRKPYPETPSISGKIVKLAEYPFDRITGELLDENQVAGNPNVEYRKMAQLEDDGVNILVPANRVPSTLPRDKQAIANEFLRSDGNESQTPTTGSQLSAEELIRKYSQ